MKGQSNSVSRVAEVSILSVHGTQVHHPVLHSFAEHAGLFLQGHFDISHTQILLQLPVHPGKGSGQDGTKHSLELITSNTKSVVFVLNPSDDSTYR